MKYSDCCLIYRFFFRQFMIKYINKHSDNKYGQKDIGKLIKGGFHYTSNFFHFIPLYPRASVRGFFPVAYSPKSSPIRTTFILPAGLHSLVVTIKLQIESGDLQSAQLPDSWQGALRPVMRWLLRGAAMVRAWVIASAWVFTTLFIPAAIITCLGHTFLDDRGVSVAMLLGVMVH